MQTLVEKITALEKAIGEVNEQVNRQQKGLKEAGSRVDEVEEGFKKLLPALSFPVEQVDRLSAQLTLTADLLSRPQQKEVRHHHHISKAVLVAGVLFVIMVILTVLLTRVWSRNEQERESDLKYRYLKLSSEGGLQKYLFQMDSLYLEDKERFRKQVLEEEARRQKQGRLRRQIERKEEEVKRLKEKAGKKS